MYCVARLVEMLDQLSKELHTNFKFSENFLVEEIQVLKEANGIGLPHTLRPNVFYHLLYSHFFMMHFVYYLTLTWSKAIT